MPNQCQQSTQLMENHIAADVLDAQKDFAAFQTSAGGIVLLAIGNDAVLRAAVETAGTGTGWSSVDLSPDLATPVQALYGPAATFTASVFAAALDVPTGTLTGLVAVTVASPSYNADLVYALSGPAGVDPTIWLLNASTRIWTALPFAPPALPAELQQLTTTGPTVAGLYIEAGIGSTAPVLAIATVDDPAQSALTPLFILDVAGGPSCWSYFLQEGDIANLQGLDEGRMSYTPEWGVYKLYTSSAAPALTFLPTSGPFGGSGVPLLFDPDPTSTAITSLVYQPQTGQTQSDLFVAAEGAIYCFPWDALPNSQGIAVITNPMIANVTRLHAVNTGDQAFLWGLNTSGVLFYTKAPIAAIEQPGAWSTPVPLLTNVQTASALAGAPADECGVCALLPMTVGTVTSAAGAAPTLLSMNPITGHWETNILPAPTTTDCITLQTYTTRVQPLDDLAPLAGAQVQVSVSADCTLLVNGVALAMRNGTSVPLTTDMGGYLDLMYEVSSLNGVVFTLTLPDDTTVTVDAAGTTTAQLAGVTADTLTSASYTDASGATQPLVAAGTEPDDVTAAAGAISTLASKSSTLPPAAATPLTERRRAALVIATTMDDGSIPLDLGDLVQFIVNVADDVSNVVLNELSEGWQIVVDVADAVFSAVIQTAEDAVHAITVAFKWIGAAFDAVFRWLAFLFDWGEIVAVHQALVAAYQQLFTAAGQNLTQWTAAAVAYLAYVKNEVLATLDPPATLTPLSSAPTPPAAYNAQSAPLPPLNATPMQADSRVGWVNARAATTPALLASAGASDPLPDLDAAFTALLTSVETLILDLAGDLEQLAAGTMSPKELLTTLLTQVADLGVDDLTNVADALGAAAEDLLPAVQSGLNSEIDIPILSPLYRVATGDALTVLDVTCLLQAVVMVIVYEVADDEDPLDALQSLDLPAAFSNAISTIPAALNAAAQQQPAAGFVGEVRTDSATGMDVFSGVILVMQGVTAFAVGVSEMKGAGPAVTWSYMSDLTTRCVRGMTEYCDPNTRLMGGATLVPVELVTNMCLAMYVLWLITQDRAATVAKVAHFDAVLSVAWGTWEVVNMARGQVDTDAGHVFEVIVEFGEPLAALACTAAEDDPANVDMVALAFSLVGLRALSAIGAGLTRLPGA